MQPKNNEGVKEYGRGNRARKQINYSDEAIDDQVLNITDYDEDDNINQENDYSPIEVPRGKREEKEKQRNNVDIDTLIRLERAQEPRKEEEFFEDEDI